MRIVLAALATAVAAALVLLVLAAFNLYVFIDAHRAELAVRGERALGRALTVGAIAPSWWPIGIRFRDVVVAEDPQFGTGPFVDAATVRVALRPLPLVLGRVEVSHVVIDRPRIAFVRDRAGGWNVASLGREPRRGLPADAKSEAQPARRKRELRLPLLPLGFSATEIRDGRIEVEDRGGAAPRRLVAEHVRVRVSELRLGGDTRVRFEAALFPGSLRPDAHLDVELAGLGTTDEAQVPFAVHLELENADLGTIAAAAGRHEPWAGRVASVVADARGSLQRFSVELAARGDGGWRLGPHLALPAVPIRVDARADASRDEITLTEVSGAFGTLEWRASGGARIRPWHAALSVQSVPGSTLAIATAAAMPLNLCDLDVTLEGGDALHIGPARARLDDVAIGVDGRLAGLEPLRADGRVHATGFSGWVDAAVDVDSAGRASMRLDAAGIDVAALAQRLSSRPPPVSGRADASITASLPWAAERPLQALSAAGTIRLADGSVAAVNVPAHVLRRMPAIQLVPQLVTGRTRAQFPDVFEAPGTGLASATLPFTVGDGVLTVVAAAVAAPSYEITGDATVDAGRGLRFHGDLVFSPDLSTALRADLPALRYLARSDGRIVVPFRIRGRVDDPVAEPDLKRLRVHGLEAWRSHAAEPSTRDDDGGYPAVVERLQRMLHP